MTRRHGPQHGAIKRREYERAATPSGESCATPSKVRYTSKKLALIYAARHRDLDLHAYRCGCGFWHVTSCDAEGRAQARERRAH